MESVTSFFNNDLKLSSLRLGYVEPSWESVQLPRFVLGLLRDRFQKDLPARRLLFYTGDRILVWYVPHL